MARDTTRRPAFEELPAAWLEAEARGDEIASEAALLSLMTRLPEVSPRPGFAARVLRQAGVARVRRDIFARRSVQWAIAASLVLAAVSLLVVPGLVKAVLSPFAGSLSVAGILGGASQLFVLAGRWVSAGAAYWRLASDIGSACSLALSKPPGALLLLGLSAVGAGAFRALNRLMSPERSAFHVPSH
jgi:hypothetical protein